MERHEVAWRRGVLAVMMAAAGVFLIGGERAKAAREPEIIGQETVIYLDGKDDISVQGDDIQSVAYSSGSTDVASVTQSGTVTPVKEGIAKIQARVTYGGEGKLQTKELSYDLQVIDRSTNYFQYQSGRVTGLTTKGKQLKEVHIPGYYGNTKVTAVQENVFDDNQVVEKVFLSDCLEYLDYYNWEDEECTSSIFDECSNLRELHIGGGLKNLGYLKNISSLEKITVHPGNQHFQVKENVLFSGDTLVCYPGGRADASYTVPENVVKIEDYAFSGALRLTKVKFTDHLKYIGASAFQKTGLVEVRLPLEINLGANAFGDCSKLDKAILPNKLEASGGVFKNCDALKTVIVPNTAMEIYGGNFYGCSSLEGFQITDGKSQFVAKDDVLFKDYGSTLAVYPMGKKNTSYTVPSGTATIQREAFASAENLKKIKLNSSLEWIEYRAFEDCKSLAGIRIPRKAHLGDDPEQCFWGCRNLKEIKVDAKNRNYSSVQGVLLDKTKGILYCYPQAKKAKSYGVPKNVYLIGKYAFADNRYLQKVTIGKKVRRIEKLAFLRAKALRQAVLPSKLEFIESGAFSDCTKLQKIVIPGKVKTLSATAFSGCTALREAVVGKSVKYVRRGAFQDCKSLRKLTFKGKKWIDWLDHDSVFYKAGSKSYGKLAVYVPKCTAKQRTKCRKALKTAGLHRKAKIKFAKK